MEIATRKTVATGGPSGADESTLLRLPVRLDEPTAGTVYYDGREYLSVDPQTLRERVDLVPSTRQWSTGPRMVGFTQRTRW